MRTKKQLIILKYFIIPFSLFLLVPSIEALNKRRKRIYSFIHSHGEVPNQMDIFEKNRQIASLDVTGYVRTVDFQGRFYFTVEDPFPRVTRYMVK